MSPTTMGEIVKFLGTLILMTRVKVKKRRNLWSTSSVSKYLPAYNFGKTGMSRHRWDTLWKCLRWSDQPSERPDEMSHEHWRWMLIRDFVDRFNEHRSTWFIPSKRICVDESMSEWYGLGGNWISMGLPVYVAIERKPVYGCEIQNACCGRSRIMMQIKVVVSSEEEATFLEENEEGQLHGTTVMLQLLEHWFNDGLCVVCGYSYFCQFLLCNLFLIVVLGL